MHNVLSDLSPATLSKVSEDHYVESFTCFSVVSGVEVYAGEDMIRVVSPGIANSLTNTVVRCRLSADNVDTVIEETNEYFRSRGVVPHWRLCPSDLPPDLGERLAAKGLSLVEEQPAMAIDLEKVNPDIRAPDGLKIERIADVEMLKESHGWIRQLGGGKSLGTLLVDVWSVYGFDAESRWQHYIAMLNGRPVSWASVFYATGVAGVYAVGTLAEARRQGIGSAITLRALLDARERGYRGGMLQSSEMGYNVYRRLGFETRFKIKVYVPATLGN